MMTRLVIAAVVVLSSGLCLGGCASSGPHRPAAINHIVLFKLNDPAQADTLIDECSSRLASIPGIVSVFAGRHVEIGRPGIEHDYDVGFYAGFNSVEDYAAYVNHPDHLAFADEWKPRLAWIRKYDISGVYPSARRAAHHRAIEPTEEP